jgi:predicted amidohydrolase YtcJ
MDPLDAIQTAITRREVHAPEGPAWIPEERSDLDTLLAAYTRGGAYLQHEEALTGSLEVGKRADLVVLERNLFDIPEVEIHRVKVLLTLLDGEEVFRDPSFGGEEKVLE